MRDNMPRQITKTFNLPLTEAEKKEFGKKAADLSFERVMLEEEFDNEKKTWKGKIDSINNDIYKLMHCLRTGKIDRELEVFVEYNYDTKTVEYVHQSEIIESRPLSAEEHQMYLRLEQKNKAEANSINEAENQEQETANGEANDQA